MSKCVWLLSILLHNDDVKVGLLDNLASLKVDKVALLRE